VYGNLTYGAGYWGEAEYPISTGPVFPGGFTDGFTIEASAAEVIDSQGSAADGFTVQGGLAAGTDVLSSGANIESVAASLADILDTRAPLEGPFLLP
jgi:hypothetical protein